MGEAADSVWAMVSGLPRGRRERRLLMVLQAYFDDSKTDGTVLVIGGYIASAKRWAHFSDEWKDVLSLRPAWRRFKASEVCGSRDCVTQERVRHHYKVIRDHVLADVGIAVPMDAFNAVCHEFNLTGADANPYFFAWSGLITLIANNAPRFGIREPIDLIFDTQSEKTKILLAWDNLEQQMPSRWRKIVKNMPAFKNDEEVMPLQAADFAAWWLRKAYTKHGTLELKLPDIIPWEDDHNIYEHLYGQTDCARIRLALMKFRDFRDTDLVFLWRSPDTGACLTGADMGLVWQRCTDEFVEYALKRVRVF